LRAVENPLAGFTGGRALRRISYAVSKERIIAEIVRTAADNGGAPLGRNRFADETGISPGSWRGKYWRTWSEALQEAGFDPNSPPEAHTLEVLTLGLISLTRQHRRFPTDAEVRLAKRADPSFPAHHAFSKVGSRPVRIELVRAYAVAHHEYRDVLEFLPAAGGAQHESAPSTEAGGDGSVYMLKMGKHYKIGHTFSVPRRHREIALELPEKPDVIHVIATDDPVGIENYWHGRFAAKRTNGEWFALTREDIRAFKRRKFM
jgi:hypothetical protein